MLVEIVDRAYWLGRVNRAIDIIEEKRSKIDLAFENAYLADPKQKVKWVGWFKWEFTPMSFEEYMDLRGDYNDYARYKYPTNNYSKSLNRLYNMRKGLLSYSTGTIKFDEKEIETVDNFSPS